MSHPAARFAGIGGKGPLVYSSKVKFNVQQLTGRVNTAVLPPNGLTGMGEETTGSGVPNADEDLSDAEDRLAKAVCRQEKGNLEEFKDNDQLLPAWQHWDYGSKELDEDEAGIIFQAMNLVMEQDEEAEDGTEDFYLNEQLSQP